MTGVDPDEGCGSQGGSPGLLPPSLPTTLVTRTDNESHPLRTPVLGRPSWCLARGGDDPQCKGVLRDGNPRRGDCHRDVGKWLEGWHGGAVEKESDCEEP